jgi:tetratricopeptide (TPR) repeat protein
MDAQGKGETETLPFYQHAVELDSQFAMAWGAMANEYYNLGEYNRASENYKKAFDFSDHVSAKEKLILQAHYYAEGRSDLEQGIRVYKQWGETYPNDWTPWVDLANEYTQIGDYAEAVTAGKRALELEPNRSINYSVLARAYLRLNRLDDARSVGREAVRRQKDSPGLHATLYTIAIAEHDQDAIARETQWGASSTDPWHRWFFPYLRAEAASSIGREKEADGLFQQAWEAAQNANMTEDGDDILVDQATIQLSLGLGDAAQATLRRTRNLDTSDPDFAVVRAKLGDTNPAEHFLAAHGSAATAGTQTVAMDLPRIRSALALLNGKPLDAVSALEPALPYDLAAYAIPTQRAEAYLKGSQPEFAILEYNKILANPGIEALSALYPLAHLGMARAYALERNNTNSRAEYNKFFDLFKAADPDLPVVRQARIEYHHLR